MSCACRTSLLRPQSLSRALWARPTFIDQQVDILLRTRKCSVIEIAAWRRPMTTSATMFSAKRLVAKHPNVKHPRPKMKVVQVFSRMTVEQLATAMDKDIDHVFECFLYINGCTAYDSPNSVIDDINVIKQVVTKSGLKFQIVSSKSQTAATSAVEGWSSDKDAFPCSPAHPSVCAQRPPVVTIMGHVDHGKTTLLDALRNSNKVEQEFGGITQHIGAFSVKMKSGDSITFLDTPGHAAFSAMRSRGAHVTDIIVLVVAADDGVMQQTLECIQHARDAAVPVIVAINKTDKREADARRVLDELQTHGLICEALGGEVIAVPISALKGTNIEALQDAILTQAELLDIRSDRTGLVEGTIIEAWTDAGLGKLATVLVQRGMLRRAAYFVAGTAYGKVRAMTDDRGQPLHSVGPGLAAEVVGWKELPSPGDQLLEVESEQRMKEVINVRLALSRQKAANEAVEAIRKKDDEHQLGYRKLLQQRLELGLKTYRRLKTGVKEKEADATDNSVPSLSIVLKGDVDGSVEAVLDVLNTYQPKLCKLDIISYGIGAVSPSDVDMASAFGGIILAFNVPVSDSISEQAVAANVVLRKHNIIYKLVDDVKELLNAKLHKVPTERVLGEAMVQKVFQVTEGKRKVPVAGCRCVKGTLEKRLLFKLVRGEAVLHTGPLHSLKHFKNEVSTIKNEMECGLSFENRTVEVQTGDAVICYEIVDVQPKVEWDLPF